TDSKLKQAPSDLSVEGSGAEHPTPFETQRREQSRPWQACKTALVPERFASPDYPSARQLFSGNPYPLWDPPGGAIAASGSHTRLPRWLAGSVRAPFHLKSSASTGLSICCSVPLPSPPLVRPQAIMKSGPSPHLPTGIPSVRPAWTQTSPPALLLLSPCE